MLFSWKNMNNRCDFQNNCGLLFHLVPSRTVRHFFCLFFSHVTGVRHLVKKDNDYVNFAPLVNVGITGVTWDLNSC